MENKTIEIQEIAYALKKRYKLIILITLLLTILAGVYGATMKKPSYTSTVKIFSGKKETAQNYTESELQSNAVLMDTYIELIKTDNFMNKVIAQSGVQTTPDGLKNSINFIKTGNTPILTIGYTNSDPDVAKNVVSTISNEFAEEVKQTILNINTKVIEDVKVVTNIPSKNRLIILGFALGLVLSIGLVLVLDYLDNTIKNREELEKVIPVPVIGELPKEKLLLKE